MGGNPVDTKIEIPLNNNPCFLAHSLPPTIEGGEEGLELTKGQKVFLGIGMAGGKSSLQINLP